MNNLKELRERSGLTQEKVAEKLLVTQGAISQWENGETFPQTKFLNKLARLYNCSIEELLPRQYFS